MYNHLEMEKKWQKIWEERGAFAAKDFDVRPKYYALIEFPYPSGEGLHVGHPRSYTAMDIIARKRRMEGYNVLYPIGFDSFGLPTENYAIKTGRPPAEITQENIANFTRQLKSMGFSFDWSRAVTTSDPAYYKWTQWIFLQLFKHGLAYKAKMPINWCPSCKIGLANEEVVDSVCERCGTAVEKREKEQWMLAITKYADKLLEGLKEVDYIERAKVQQENWIGRSEGAELEFRIKNAELRIEVFTTRPDTLFGATYLVLAPEYSLIGDLRLKISNWDEVEKYIEQTKKTPPNPPRTSGGNAGGVELKGVKAINPATKGEIPVWVADYVFAEYGTGAIMAVPAHDERDFSFANKYGLPIREVVRPSPQPSPTREREQKKFPLPAGEGKGEGFNGAYAGSGTMVNSGAFDGLDNETAKWKITEAVGGVRKVNYKLRDWVFSRQRYWGEPIPLVYCERCKERGTQHQSKLGTGQAKNKEQSEGERLNPGWIPLTEKELPLELPKVEKYQPTDIGESPLAAMSDWVNTKCPRCGGLARRETDTMPNWAGSSWYFLRYCDPENKKEFASMEKLRYWMGSPSPLACNASPDGYRGVAGGPNPPSGRGGISSGRPALPSPEGEGGVDWYNGGMEHTVLHLLYSRFWNQFLYDIGLVPTREPYRKRTSHGLILAEDGEKMSKSRGNVVNPDEIVEKHGADTLRLYEMFMGPFDQSVPWSTRSIVGIRRFFEKVWGLQSKVSKINETSKTSKTNKTPPNPPLTKGGNTGGVDRLLHKTIKKVTEDIEAMKFNTAIAALMTLVNDLSKQDYVLRPTFYVLLQLLHPFAPHITEELWERVCSSSQPPLKKRGGDDSIPPLKIRGDRGVMKMLCEAPWPTYDPAFIHDEEIELVIQVNGKVRDRATIVAGTEEGEIKKMALESEKVRAWTKGQAVRQVIVVKGRLVNIVTGR